MQAFLGRGPLIALVAFAAVAVVVVVVVVIVVVVAVLEVLRVFKDFKCFRVEIYSSFFHRKMKGGTRKPALILLECGSSSSF